MRAALEKRRTDLILPRAAWRKPWVIHCTAWGDGAEAVLRYLARYVFRVAITEARIVGLDDTGVTVRHKHRKSARWRTLRLDGHEFMRRFLQHVLPKGLHKVRYSGLWHPSRRDHAVRVRDMLALDPTTSAGKTSPTRRSRPSLTARHRRAQMHAFAPAAGQATFSMCASSTPGRCVDHEPPGRLSAIAPGRAGHATVCYRPPVASSGSPSADVPFGSLNLAPESPSPASSRHRPATGFPPAAHHQPRRRPGKSIAANAAPRVQSNRVSAAASRLRNSYFVSLALASLDRACWDHVPPFPRRSRPQLLTTAAHGGLGSAT
jgi:hypothetical protein